MVLVVSMMLVFVVSALGDDQSDAASHLATFSPMEAYDEDYRSVYLAERGYFSDLTFSEVSDTQEIVLTTKTRNTHVRGIQTASEGYYALDLIACNKYDSYCVVRVNGVPQRIDVRDGRLVPNRVALDETTSLVVKQTRMEHCDAHRFCNLAYESYDMIVFEVERGG